MVLEEAFASLIENGDLERHFRKSLKIYKHRRDLFCTLLHSDFSNIIEYNIPEGGLAVWSVFDKSINLEKLSQSAEKQGLSIGDGKFYKNEIFNPNGLRLGFASLNDQRCSKHLKF